jgi:hypothetical protein
MSVARARPAPQHRAGKSPAKGVATLDAMDYVSAIVPPLVMAVFFIGLVMTIIKHQGGANKAKEDAAVDAAFAAETARRSGPEDSH